jgi:uncharacterized lipoprotein NlpE involved in copper resistance
MIVGLEEAKSETNKQLSLGYQLANNHNRVLYEDKRSGRVITMAELMEGMPKDSMIRSHTAIMMENTRRYIDSLDETTKLVNIGN